MHEFSLIADLFRKIDAVARQEGARRVSRVAVSLGALAHISPDHFREHFDHAARGTVAEGARLEVELLTDEQDPHAQEIRLTSIDVELDDG